MTILASNTTAFVCPKELAYILGDSDAAIFLQQVHYYLEHESGKVIDGVRWIYNTYSQWLTEIPHLTEWRFRTIVKLLKAHGLLMVERHDRVRYNQRCWYTIDYEALKALLGSSRGIPTGRGRGKPRIESEDSDASSIYKEFHSKNTPIEDNNTATAVDREWGEEIEDWDEEEETPTSLAGNPSQDVTNETEEVEDPHEEKNASLVARYHNNIVNLQLYGIVLNKQLDKIAAKYSEKEVERSLEYMEERIEAGKVITNRAGWLTDCLKDEWWRQSSKSLEEAAILEGLGAMGLKLNSPEQFFDALWQMVGQDFIEPTPVDLFEVKHPIGRFLHIQDGDIFVSYSIYNPEVECQDWWGTSFKKKFNEFRVRQS